LIPNRDNILEKVSQLIIPKNNIGNIGAKLLSEMLRLPNCLVKLDISQNSIDQTGFKHLFSSLQNNKQIVELNIGNPEVQYSNVLGQGEGPFLVKLLLDAQRDNDGSITFLRLERLGLGD
jgi:hypothetical protein